MPLDSNSVEHHSTCKNCSAPLSGHNFCAQCGQKADTHILNFHELLEEFADGLFNLDARVWRSLLPLVLHPGKLTNEYLAGKRMLFLPPFRLYLILSLLFFILPEVSFISVQGENPSFNTTNTDDLNLEQFGNSELAREIREEIQQELETANQQASADEGFMTEEECNLSNFNQGTLLTALVRNACLMMNDDPERLMQQIENNIPVMMLIGLPLVALIMQMFYAFSNRYYVEHIIFLFHIHSFYFLVSILMSITSILGQSYESLFTPFDWIRIALAFYIPVYIFYAMKNVYGESGIKTTIKAFFLIVSYMACIGIVMAIGSLFAAMSL